MFRQSTKNEHWYFITRTVIQKIKLVGTTSDNGEKSYGNIVISNES